MEFKLSEKEISHIIAAYVTEKGINPGNSIPKVELSKIKNDIVAFIDVAIDITVGFGAGAVEVLSNKPKVDLEPFKAEAQEAEVETPLAKPKRKRRTKAEIEAEKAVKEEPVKEVAPIVDDLVEEEVPIEADSSRANLFEPGIGKEEESTTDEGTGSAPAADLFGGNTTTSEAKGESDKLVEEAAPAVAPANVTADTLFASN